MKSSARSMAFATFAVCALIAAALPAAYAQTGGTAPVNPAFLEYIQSRAEAKSAATEDRPRGEIPTLIDFSYLKGRAPALKGISLPATYDLRALGKLTPVRNQGNYGTCWTFATLGSVESTLLTGETRDFSENNMANLHGFDLGYDDGGNFTMATAYLARWRGPVNESDDPYANGPGNSPSNLPAQKHVQEVRFLAGKTNALDNSAIKQAVMSAGAVYVSMYSDFDTNNYFNPATHAFYYDGDSNTDHAVAIVGWDDDYAAGNFLQAPPGNGAFIVRNSWGASWGDAGYFYCSYYDNRMCSGPSASFNNAEPATNFNSVYQYDPYGRVQDYGYGAVTAWGANIFTATNSDALRAVGFYATDINISYEISVYTDLVNSTNPCMGTLQTTQSGLMAYAGYHTITLSTPVALASGKSFSVVIKLVNSAYLHPLAVEFAYPGYCSHASSSPGQSFVSPDGTSWKDLTDWDTSANACIKAYCGTGTAPAQAVPAIADYDGDRLSDPAIYNESTGIWLIKKSASNYALTSTNFGGLGGSGYTAASADFDGDRIADPAVYQGAHGDWNLLLSSANYTLLEKPALLGGSNFSAAPGDFDGDRIADPAVYNTASGYWVIMLSSAGYVAIAMTHPLGGTGYSACPADYDGDAKADPAICGESTGLWTIMLSSAGYASITLSQALGGTGYLPCPGDYDGDAKADPAVKSSAGNEWIVMFSTGGYAPVPLTIAFE